MKVLHIGKTGNMEHYIKDAEWLRKLTIVDLPRGLSNKEYLDAASDVEAIVADAIATIDEELLSHMPNLRLLHSEGVAVNSFDLDAAQAAGVTVCNCKGMNAYAVAEQTILLMLGVLRDCIRGDEAVRAGEQITVKDAYIRKGNLLELSDCTVGLYGFGDIAKSVATILKAMEVKTYYYSRHQATPEIEEQYGVTYLPQEELLSTCNMISIHCPVTKETTNLVNDDFFAQIPDNSYLINTARGEIVDSQALVRALLSGKLCMAGLDTIAGEPVMKDNELLQSNPLALEKIVFSPHIGGITGSSFKKGYAMIQENLENLMEGKQLKNVCK